MKVIQTSISHLPILDYSSHRCLSPRFSTLILLASWARSLLAVGTVLHCRMISSISGLYSSDARSTLNPSPKCDYKNVSWHCPMSPGGENLSLIEPPALTQGQLFCGNWFRVYQSMDVCATKCRVLCWSTMKHVSLYDGGGTIWYPQCK